MDGENGVTPLALYCVRTPHACTFFAWVRDDGQRRQRMFAARAAGSAYVRFGGRMAFSKRAVAALRAKPVA